MDLCDVPDKRARRGGDVRSVASFLHRPDNREGHFRWCGGYYASNYVGALRAANVTATDLLTKDLVKDPDLQFHCVKQWRALRRAQGIRWTMQAGRLRTAWRSAARCSRVSS